MGTGMLAHSVKADSAQPLAVKMHARRLRHFLRGRRDHLGLSQEEVAARLGISARAYGNWERGQVKEWTDQKLYALAPVPEMSAYQTARFFWITVDRPPRPDVRSTFRRDVDASGGQASAAFLDGCSAMMEAVSFPALALDRRWGAKMANRTYGDLFCNVWAHPIAMPSANFLRFGLFHPDGPSILADYADWQLTMLAQFSCSLERHDQKPTLQDIRRSMYLHPASRNIYVRSMPDWLSEAGADFLHYDGAVRELRHPDLHVGLQECRLVEETPRSLQAVGLIHITLMFAGLDEGHIPERDRSREHHAA